MTDRVRPATFDAGGLIAIERGNARVRAYLEVLAEAGVLVYVPTAAIAEVWRGGRGRQTLLARWLRVGLAHDRVRIVDLDYPTARAVGELLGRAPMSLADAAVCHAALVYGTAVVTSDPIDIARVVKPDLIVRV